LGLKRFALFRKGIVINDWLAPRAGCRRRTELARAETYRHADQRDENFVVVGCLQINTHVAQGAGYHLADLQAIAPKRDTPVAEYTFRAWAHSIDKRVDDGVWHERKKTACVIM
jgi:hypothetical protein